MDWTTIGAWIIQGIILFGFATLGIVVGQYLLNRMQRSSPAAPVPQSQAVVPTIAAAPAPTSPFAAAAAPATAPTLSVADLDIERAVEFTENDRMLLVMDMPAKLLNNDKALIDAWIESVGWARVEHQKWQRGQTDETAATGVAAAAIDPLIENPEILGDKLNQVLNRLQLSAERRRHFRDLLAENFPADEEA